MKKSFSLLLTIFVILFALYIPVFATEDIIIFYENDVHCAADGYSLLKGLKNEALKETDYVGVVSSGDFIQGGNLGVVSKGEYIINLMNLVGYDAVGLGNHEFDYKLNRLFELQKMLNAPLVNVNLKNEKNESVFEPYKIITYGETKVAFLGVVTPETITSSSPTQFKNEKGDYIYSFSPDNLCETIQEGVDSAKKKGADYVILLSHLGTMEGIEKWSTQYVAKNTTDIDVILDAHSHAVIEKEVLENKNGEEVYLTSTGTKFENIGKLTISKNGTIDTKLIKTEECTVRDEKVLEYTARINEEYKNLGERKVGVNNVNLVAYGEGGTRIVRKQETNLGNLCADAYRIVTNSDIGMANGGGVRADVQKGDITFNDLLTVFPFNNQACVVEVTGSTLLDVLEFSVREYPNENGGFMQVSGLKFDFDPQVKSSVEVDEKDAFVKTCGERRVSNVFVLNSQTKEWEKLDVNQTYSVASNGFVVSELGDGYTMFKDRLSLTETGMLDIEILESYVTENLNGVIGEEYNVPENRINILDEYIPLRKTFEEEGCEVIWNAEDPLTIVVRKSNVIITFTAGTNIMMVNKALYKCDRTAYIENGTTYISKDCLSFAGVEN